MKRIIAHATLVLLITAIGAAACGPTGSETPAAISTLPVMPAGTSAPGSSAGGGTAATNAVSQQAAVEPVVLQVLTPLDGDILDLAQCQVIGTTSPGAVVTVNDEILIAGSDGAFQTTLTLDEGVNLIEIVASNASGNEAFVNLTVTYQP